MKSDRIQGIDLEDYHWQRRGGGLKGASGGREANEEDGKSSR